MELLRFLIFLLYFYCLCPRLDADEGLVRDISESETTDSLRIELEEPKSNEFDIVSTREEIIRDLKDKRLLQMEKIIQEKSDNVASLQREMELLQKKGSVVAEEQVGKAHARAGELEKQVVTLKKELEAQNMKRNALEAQVSGAEIRLHELTSKLQSLEKINDDQKNRIHKMEHALQVAEEVMIKAKLDATLKANELLKMHNAWLPTWLETRMTMLQSFIMRHWHAHGKPVADATVQKVSEKSSEAQRWAEPHLESFRLKVVPVVKAKWSILRAVVGPCVESVISQAAEAFKLSKTVLLPHVVEMQQLATLYFQKLVPVVKAKWSVFGATFGPYVEYSISQTVEIFKWSEASFRPHMVEVQRLVTLYIQECKCILKPYVNQAAAFAKPHVEKARIAIKPYTKKVVHIYRKFFRTATLYHQKVHTFMRQHLKHKLMKFLAAGGLELFVASALMVLPIYLMFKLIVARFCKKGTSRRSSVQHGHHRSKRRRADK